MGRDINWKVLFNFVKKVIKILIQSWPHIKNVKL